MQFFNLLKAKSSVVVSCALCLVLLGNGDKALAATYADHCLTGDGTFCVKAGFDTLRTLPVDEYKAIDWFKRACNLGQVATCIDQGEFTLLNRTISGEGAVNPVSFLQKGCQSGQASYCRLAVALIDSLQNPSAKSDPALPFAERGCSLNDGVSCYLVGQKIERFNKDQEQLTRALKFYDKACSLDVAVGCTAAGRMYKNGRGIKKDPETAAENFIQACYFGDAEGCIQAVNLKRQGLIAKDLFDSGEFSHYACSEDFPDQCLSLGVNRQLPGKDQREFLIKACNLADAGACELAETRSYAPRGYYRNKACMLDSSWCR